MAHLPALLYIMDEVDKEERILRLKDMTVQKKRLKDMSNPFDMAEPDFQALFRASRDMANHICQELDADLEGQRTYMPSHIKVLAVLRFLAEGSFQRGIGQDILCQIGQTTVSKYVGIILPIIVQNFGHLLKFPQTARERLEVSQGFERICGLPGILGAIDCTHIAISAPREMREDYYNHKQFHSLNIQMMCDSQQRITNVNAKFPGGTEDQTIWESSGVKAEMERLHAQGMGQFYLIGDSSYVAERYLLTPEASAVVGASDARYTYRHCQIRNIMERSFGLLKARWKCIHKSKVLAYSPTKAAQIVISCAILHNMCLQFGVPEPCEEEIRAAHENEEPRPPRDMDYRTMHNNMHVDDRHIDEALRVRDQLIRRYFH